jgi:putative ABC transport system ATP-binding protein
MTSSFPSSDPILKVERIYKSYSSTAGETPILKNIDFDVKRENLWLL